MALKRAALARMVLGVAMLALEGPNIGCVEGRWGGAELWGGCRDCLNKCLMNTLILRKMFDGQC